MTAQIIQLEPRRQPRPQPISAFSDSSHYFAMAAVASTIAFYALIAGCLTWPR